MPALTVLLRAGSDPEAILQTVQDLSAQSFADFEVLVLDEGAAPLQELNGVARVRVIAAAGRSGGEALNLGLEAAQGSLIVRISAGDLSAPDRLARQASLLASSPELAFVVTGWRSMLADGGVERQVLPPAADAGLRLAMAQGDALGHATAMMRLDVVQRSGGWRPAFVGSEDYDLLLRLLDRHRGAAVPDALVECAPPATTATWREMEQSILSALAAVTAHDRRQVGRPDHGERTAPVDRTVLHRMGVADEEVTGSIVGHALSAAVSAGAAGQWRAMREAARLGLRQEGLPGKLRSQFMGLWIRSVARRRPSGGVADAIGSIAGLSADRG